MADNSIYMLLFQALQKGTIQDVQRAASIYFNSAVSVTDNSFRVLSADIDPGSTDDMLEKNGDHVYVSGELLELFREHNLIYSLSSRPHETIVVDWGYFSEHPHLTTGIFWENHILGSITVLVNSNEYTEEQHNALQACAEACAMVLHEKEAGRKRINDRDYFISKLFNGSASQKDLDNAEKNHYFRPSTRYVVLATDFVPDNVWKESSEKNSRTLLFQDSGITHLMASAQSHELKDLQKWIVNRGHRFGMSYEFSDPLLTNRMAKQASAVLSYGTHSGSKQAEWYFAEHALDMMLNNLEETENFVHPGILEMEQYDVQNHTQYLETLRQWLLHRMDYSETAKAMNLHRNSLYYRMQRIYELFGLDISDMNTDVQLYLSLIRNNIW